MRIGQEADLVVVAPATADLLARAAHGLAGDLLTNVLLTARCPVVMAPAMHTEMWQHAATQANVATLRERGLRVFEVSASSHAGLRELWLALRELAPVRFIEFMDVGNHNGWNLDSVVPSREVLARLGGEAGAGHFQPVRADYRGEVASRYADPEGREVGLISSVTAPFCGDCSRARLSDGFS